MIPEIYCSAIQPHAKVSTLVEARLVHASGLGGDLLHSLNMLLSTPAFACSGCTTLNSTLATCALSRYAPMKCSFTVSLTSIYETRSSTGVCRASGPSTPRAAAAGDFKSSRAGITYMPQPVAQHQPHLATAPQLLHTLYEELHRSGSRAPTVSLPVPARLRIHRRC